MTKEELIKVIKEEVAINGDVPFVVESWNGSGYNSQNGVFTETNVIREVNGVEVKESYEEIDDDVLVGCYEGRVTMETLLVHAKLNTLNNKFTIASIVGNTLQNMIGEDSIEIGLSEYGNHYDEVYWDNGQYYLSIRYYNEDGSEEVTSEPIHKLSIELLSAIFRKINK